MGMRAPWTSAYFVVILSLIAGLMAESVEAGKKAKVYRYRTADGKVDVGQEVPPGAEIIEEVGEVEVPLTAELDSVLQGPSGIGLPFKFPIGGAPTLYVFWDWLRVKPIHSLSLLLIMFLLAALVIYIMPTTFRTRTLSWHRCLLTVSAVCIYWFLLALCGIGLSALWSKITWSPQDWLGREVVAGIATFLYAIVPFILLWLRLGVSFVKAILLTLLWALIVGGAGLAIWLWGMPWLISNWK